MQVRRLRLPVVGAVVLVVLAHTAVHHLGGRSHLQGLAREHTDLQHIHEPTPLTTTAPTATPTATATATATAEPPVVVGAVRFADLASELERPSSAIACQTPGSPPVVCRDCCARFDDAQHALHLALHGEGRDADLALKPLQPPETHTTARVRFVAALEGGPRELPFLRGTTQFLQSAHASALSFGFVSVLTALYTQRFLGMDQGRDLPRPHRFLFPVQRQAVSPAFQDMLARVTGAEVTVGLGNGTWACFEALVVGECVCRGFSEASTPRSVLRLFSSPRLFRKRIRAAYALADERVGALQRVLFVVRPEHSAHHRHIVNQDEVRAALERDGLEVHMREVRESDTLDDTAQMFAWADIIIAANGAALANVLFARDNALVLELTPHNVARRAYRHLALGFGLRYSRLWLTQEESIATRESVAADTPPLERPAEVDLRINVDTLRQRVLSLRTPEPPWLRPLLGGCWVLCVWCVCGVLCVRKHRRDARRGPQAHAPL